MRAISRVTGVMIAILLSISAYSAKAESHSFKCEKTLGLAVGYCGSNRSALTGLEFSYRFSRWFRTAAEVDYVFRNHLRDALFLGINTQYPFMFCNDCMAVYPEVGVNYTSWNFHYPKNSSEANSATDRVSRFGLNFGAGYDVDLTPSLRLGAKAGYMLVKNYGSFNAQVKIAIRF